MSDVLYFGTFDTDGYPIGFYPSDVWPVPPDGAVEITELQWREFLDNQGHRKYVDGKVIDAPPKPLEVPPDV